MNVAASQIERRITLTKEARIHNQQSHDRHNYIHANTKLIT